MEKHIFDCYYIPELWQGARLDRWLRSIFPSIPQSRFERALRQGKIRMPTFGKVKASFCLSQGMEVQILKALSSLWSIQDAVKAFPPLASHHQQALDQKAYGAFKPLILYEDAWILGINKPSGLPSQGGLGISFHADAMAAAWANIQGTARPLLVHRLDKSTSGILVFAKNRLIAGKLGKSFAQRTTKKVYWAIVKTARPWAHPFEGAVEAPLLRGHFRNREAVRVSYSEEEEDAFKAKTFYCYKGGFFCHDGGFYHWLELYPFTGRMHQLRVHCAALGAPIVGDARYGEAKKPDSPLLLHAKSLSLSLEGENIILHAPAPFYMQDWIKKMKAPSLT